MNPSEETCGDINGNSSSPSRYGSFDTTFSIKKSHEAPSETGKKTPPKPAVRQRTLNKQLNKTTELATSKVLNGDQISTESSNKLDNRHENLVNNTKSSVDQELITLNHYYVKEARNNPLGNNHIKNTKETISLPLQSNQQVTSKDLTTRSYPYNVLFIVANEFCERFSFYGFKTILVLYFTTVLGFSDSKSTVLFHLFVSSCYLSPLLGAILADSVWGKFKTVLYLSILYFLGEVILTISSVFWNYGAISIGTTFFGLIMVSVGTGGIKPAVSALGADQFLPHEERWRQSFFSLFYGAINLGSLISMFSTPILRSQIKCVNRGDCYPLAFGLPCALMFLAIIVFLLAKNKYVLVPVAEQNVITAFCRCVWLATKRKVFGYNNNLSQDTAINKKAHNNLSTLSILEQESTSSSSLSMNSGEDVLISVKNSSDKLSNQRQQCNSKTNIDIQVDQIEKQRQRIDRKSHDENNHWLYLASDRFDSKSIEDFRAILAILFLFIPFPIYWCLYDQQGSLWTLQANRMDGRILNTGFVLDPDQIGVVNPVIVIALIPVFEFFIYPSLGKCGLLINSIQRMTVGGLILSLAFVTSGLLELHIQNYLPPTQPDAGQANLLLLNGLNECSIVSSVISYNQKPSLYIEGTSNYMNTSQQTTNSMINLNMLTHTFDLLQPFNVQSLDLLSSNVSLLDSYQLRFRLTSSISSANLSSSSPSTSSLGKTTGCPFSPTIEYEFNLKPLSDRSVKLLYLTQGNGKLEYKVFNESLELPIAGKARVRLLYESFGSSNQVNKRQFSLTRSASIDQNDPIKMNNKTGGNFVFETKLKDGLVSISDYLDTSVPAKGETYILQTNDALIDIKKNQKIHLKPGTRNLIVVHQKDAINVEIKHDLLQDNDYRVSMLYQIVPYVLLSSAEIMFSITGLEFCYAMAPLSMKSLVLGFNSLTNSFGNFLVVALESMHLFSNISNEFFFYATIMLLDMILLAIIGYYYKPYNSNGKTNK